MSYDKDVDVYGHELYAAERCVGWAAYDADENLQDLKDVWLFVTKLINRKSFAKRYPNTHRRFSVSGKLEPVAFPKIVLTKDRWISYDSEFHMGAVAGGRDGRKWEDGWDDWVVRGHRSPDAEVLRKGTFSSGKHKSYIPTGLTIYPSTRNGGAANRDMIELNKWARKKWIILHELAHDIDWNENGSPNARWHQGHGWQFCQIYIHIVGMVFGHDCKTELRQEMKAGGVRDTRPRGARNQFPNDPNPDREWVT